ncbi:hypothetical protein C0J52_15283 [Blattella germanica]|nr:hypothetical protein C0J52_15283 [Blattella germanica]
MATNSGSLEAQLQALSDKLAQKEQQLRASRTKISQAEQKLYTLQANSSQCRKLHDHINTITKRREEIWNQVMQLTTEPKLNKRLRDRCKQKKTIHVCTDQNEANNIKIEVCTNEESPCFCVQSSSNSRDVDGNVFALCCPEDRTTSRNETNKICPSTQQKTARCRRCGGRKKSPPCIGQPPIFCTDKINAKFQPEKFTLEEEIVEYVEPDSYECQTSAGFRRKLEIETFTNEYEETENCSPPNVCDCCVSEYEKFRQSCQ